MVRVSHQKAPDLEEILHHAVDRGETGLSPRTFWTFGRSSRHSRQGRLLTRVKIATGPASGLRDSPEPNVCYRDNKCA